MPAVSPACLALLAAARRFGPLYGPGYSNHLPMALIALDRMGAAPDGLRRFVEQYEPRLQPAGAAVPVTEPFALCGGHDNYGGLAAWFDAAAAAQDDDAVLRAWLPRLLPGLAAAGFHALIRLAYGLDARDRGEVCAALAFWVMAYKPIPVPAARSGETVPAIAARIGAAVGTHGAAGLTIGARMANVERSPLLETAQPERIALADVAAFALAAFHASKDFMLLHTVTACHALRMVLPWIDDEEGAVRQLWQAVLAAWLAADRHGGAAQRTARDWPALWDRALNSTDDHVIKLCYTARAEHAVYGDARYLDIAARATAS